jgi:hypothetical protein
MDVQYPQGNRSRVYGYKRSAPEWNRILLPWNNGRPVEKTDSPVRPVGYPVHLPAVIGGNQAHN